MNQRTSSSRPKKTCTFCHKEFVFRIPRRSDVGYHSESEEGRNNKCQNCWGKKWVKCNICRKDIIDGPGGLDYYLCKSCLDVCVPLTSEYEEIDPNLTRDGYYVRVIFNVRHGSTEDEETEEFPLLKAIKNDDIDDNGYLYGGKLGFYEPRWRKCDRCDGEIELEYEIKSAEVIKKKRKIDLDDSDSD